MVSVAEGVAGSQAARQLQLFGASPTDFLDYVRTISLVQDGSRWRFDAHGAVQDFEEVGAYTARRVKDRFTPEMLERYCHALELAPFAHGCHVGPSRLVSNASVPGPGAPVMSLEEARREWYGTG